MPKRVLSIRPENPEEKRLREWFETQALDSPKTLAEAARLLIGLVTGLLGALFGVFTLSAESLPCFLSLPLVRLGIIDAVLLWLISVFAGLIVVLPIQWKENPGRPDTQSKMFADILRRKSVWLAVAVVTFGGGILALAVVLVAAILMV